MAPLRAAEFAALIATQCPIPRDETIAVAVSGGADSMALTLLAHVWAQSTGRRLRAVTVDHGLRAESAAEAAQVKEWLGPHGIDHDVLIWHGEKPASGVQAAARDARYRLIGDWARANAIGFVLVAHHSDDQAETILMRLARGSGALGLAGMRSVAMRNGLRICRPLLSVPKARLRASLTAMGQGWIEDPSNHSSKYARTAQRHLNARLAEHGIEPARIAALGQSFARLDALMQAASRCVLGAAARRLPDGGISLPRPLYADLPAPVAARVLRDILAEVGAKPLAPRGDRLARAQERLGDPTNERAFTLGGCRIDIRRGQVRFRPEGARRTV